MKEKKMYAVVDIETTGGNVESGDRMIQFGCVFIEDNQIVQQFSTDINPLVKIPKEIEHLTGLTNKAVATSPYFEDLASTIYNMLQGCIFVAHNIQFDYRFLSDELVRCGLPPLSLKGMDTVELSQILLPTEPSFRLNDLVSKFNIIHENPHRADSDAYVTAELFLLLKQKLRSLPLVTIEKLIDLSSHCTMETNLFFIEELPKIKQTLPPLPDSIVVKNGIAIRKKKVTMEQRSYRETSAYPKDQQEKEKIFKKKITERPGQITMMDAVYDYFSNDQADHFVIEAATGIGKTLGYLFPLAYVATADHPVVISTYTTLLQKQLLEKDVSQLNSLLPFEVKAAILKSKSHYVHLSKFQEVLRDPVEQHIEAIYRMRVLTWLTETVTGDLDELHLPLQVHPFWNKIRHRGWLKNKEEDSWFEDDFYLHAKKQVEEASILITNHAFLCHDLKKEERELPNIQKLVVDEAHHLAETAVLTSSDVFRYYQFQNIMKKIGKESDEATFLGQISRLAHQSSMRKNLASIKNIDMTSFYLEEEVSKFVDSLIRFSRGQKESNQATHEQVDVSLQKTSQFDFSMKKTAKQIVLYMEEICYLGFELVNKFLATKDQFTQREHHIWNDFYDLISELKEQQSVFQTIFQSAEQNEITWISYKEKSPKSSFTVKRSNINSQDFLRTRLLHETPFILYTGASLQVNDSFDFFEEQVGEKNLKQLILSTPYDYLNQARLWIPKETSSIKDMTKREYTNMIVKNLRPLVKQTNENILVLFNSYEPLQRVYESLQKDPDFMGREILAQGLSGSRERILKRFFHSSGGILLGADSFWEGVDLPGKSLRLIVVTRLPFDSPDRPFTKAKYDWLKEKNLDPFQNDSLPKATMRLKQGLGRLIRSETDKGVMIVLDNRLIHTAFGRQMLQALPKDLPKEQVVASEMGEKLKSFLFDTSSFS